MQKKLSDTLGQPIVIEHRVAAGGVLGKIGRDIATNPGGPQGARVLALTAGGASFDFATFTDGDALSAVARLVSMFALVLPPLSAVYLLARLALSLGHLRNRPPTPAVPLPDALPDPGPQSRGGRS